MKTLLKVSLSLLFLLVISFGLFLWYAIRPAALESKFPRAAILTLSKAEPIPAPPTSLKVVSYNIGYGSGIKNNKLPLKDQAELETNLARMATDLKALQPDLLFLQEVDFRSSRTFDIDQLRYLAEKLQLPYAAYVLTWNKNYVAWPYWPFSRHFGRIISGQALLSRYPIRSQQLIEFPKPPGNAFWYNWFYLDRIVQHFLIEIGTETISAYNVHLEAFALDSRDEQLAALGRLLKADPHPAKIAAGDFNIADLMAAGHDDDSDRDTKGLLKKFAQTTQLQHATGSQTFYSMPSWEPYKLIDHIFFSARFKLEKAGNILNSTASDHLAVWANLGF